MHNRIDPFETDTHSKRAWVTPLSDAQIDDPMHKTPSNEQCTGYGSDAEIMI